MSVGRHGNRTRLEIGAWRPPRLLVYNQFQLNSPKNIEQYPRLLPFVLGCSSRCSTYYTRPTPGGCYMLLHLLDFLLVQFLQISQIFPVNNCTGTRSSPCAILNIYSKSFALAVLLSNVLVLVISMGRDISNKMFPR